MLKLKNPLERLRRVGFCFLHGERTVADLWLAAGGPSLDYLFDYYIIKKSLCLAERFFTKKFSNEVSYESP